MTERIIYRGRYALNDEMVTCPLCKGEKEFWVNLGADDVEKEMCEECSGVGKVPAIGFYPTASIDNENVWSGMANCPACGYKMLGLKDCYETGCPRCHRTFID